MSTKYAQADPDALGICDLITVPEGDDYPYNDDRYTFTPDEYLTVHLHCFHRDGAEAERAYLLAMDILENN